MLQLLLEIMAQIESLKKKLLKDDEYFAFWQLKNVLFSFMFFTSTKKKKLMYKVTREFFKW